MRRFGVWYCWVFLLVVWVYFDSPYGLVKTQHNSQKCSALLQTKTSNKVYLSTIFPVYINNSLHLARKYINSSLHLARKHARIFVRGHYLFRDANSFPRAKLEESCELRGTDNVQGQISEHIFAPNGGYCLYYPSNIFKQGRSILETFSENYLTSKQLCRHSKYFLSIKMFSSGEYHLGNITWGIYNNYYMSARWIWGDK